jgi:SAM-dependent MidA family methyltransferase
MLTIDYGANSAEEIYDRRPGGTMRAYHRQQRIEGGGIYARFGRQDLTSDVNFADLVRWGEALGW